MDEGKVGILAFNQEQSALRAHTLSAVHRIQISPFGVSKANANLNFNCERMNQRGAK